MNGTNSSSQCDGNEVTEPPTTHAACTFPLVANNPSAAISACCREAPVLAFHDPTQASGPDCFQYCNISQADYQSQAVANCLIIIPGITGTFCKGTTSPTTSQSAPSAGVLGNLLLLAVAMSLFGNLWTR